MSACEKCGRDKAVCWVPESDSCNRATIARERAAKERAEMEAQEMRRERNEARNHLDGMTRSRDAAREENRKMVEGFKRLKTEKERAEQEHEAAQLRWDALLDEREQQIATLKQERDRLHSVQSHESCEILHDGGAAGCAVKTSLTALEYGLGVTRDQLAAAEARAAKAEQERHEARRKRDQYVGEVEIEADLARERAERLRTALEAVLPYAESRAEDMRDRCAEDPADTSSAALRDKAWTSVETARAALADQPAPDNDSHKEAAHGADQADAADPAEGTHPAVLRVRAPAGEAAVRLVAVQPLGAGDRGDAAAQPGTHGGAAQAAGGEGRSGAGVSGEGLTDQPAPAPRRPLTYLACPYSHADRDVRLARFAAANHAAGVLMAAGHKVFSPISHTHPIAEAHALPLGWDFWEAFDRAYLAHSARVVVLRVQGWDTSKGVAAEIAIAGEMGIPVEYVDPAPAKEGA